MVHIQKTHIKLLVMNEWQIVECRLRNIFAELIVKRSYFILGE